jgi:NADP-dependent 3-hydroxy acid dehydrogenase YdfG
MAREGASVVVADINGSAAERVAGELAHAAVAEVDVADESSVARMISNPLLRRPQPTERRHRTRSIGATRGHFES